MGITELDAGFSALVVGLGSVGMRHLENLRRLGCRRIGVFRSRNAPLHRPLDLTDVAVHYEFDEALERGYDAAVICNPTSLHTEFASRAAASGCHLYVEKPISNTLENTDELARNVKRNGLVAAVGCQFRFHPNLTAIEQWLGEEVIGRVLGVHVDTGEYLPGWHSWEDYREGYAAREDLGGGVVLTLIHEIDYLYWLLGPLHPVSAFGGTSGVLDLAVEDHLTAMLLTKSGVPVTLHVDYLQRPPCRRMKIVGSRGTVEWDYYLGTASAVVDGKLKEGSSVPKGWERNDMFLAIMSDFLDAVRAGRTPRVPLEDGVETLRIALELKAQLPSGAGVL